MAIYCNKCGTRHECSICPVCAGFGMSNLQVAAGVGKSFQPTDELQAKFEVWACNNGYRLFTIVPDDEKYFSGRRGQYSDHMVEDAWKAWQAAHASRDAEVEALRKDAERYRWLRECVTACDAKPFICVFQGSFSLCNYEYADREIDAAMQEESK